MGDDGQMLSLITFPGVIIHELGHKLFCDWMGVKVRKVCYFRIGNPVGYVEHDLPKTFKQSFFISVGPFITGFIFSLFIFTLTPLFPINSYLQYFLGWLGISIAMNSFPSSGDASVLWQETNRHLKNNLFAVIGYPFALLIWISDFLSVIWFDFFYAIFLYGIMNPEILIYFIG